MRQGDHVFSTAGEAIGSLRAKLDSIPNGPVPGDQQAEVKELLINAWKWLEGRDEQSTDAGKLDRVENLQWQSPILTFVLERHGATVLGSISAALHRWEVNLDTSQAVIVEHRERQLKPKDRQLDVQAIAEEVIDAIINHQERPWLKWRAANQVQVEIGRLIQETNAQTTSARRKRFRKVLADRLAHEGWTSPNSNFFEKREQAHENRFHER
jgi:hypothetical protein